MTKPGNLGLAIGAPGITNRNLDNFEAQFGRAKDEVKIAERIEISKMMASGFEPDVVRAAQNLGTAQSIGKALPEQPSEKK